MAARVQVRILEHAVPIDGRPVGYVVTDEETMVRLPIRAVATSRAFPFDVEFVLDYVKRLDKVAIVELTLRARPGEHIVASVLRAPVNLAQLIEEAVRAVAEYTSFDETNWKKRAKGPSNVRVFTHNRTERHGRTHAIRDDELPQVLRVYEKGGTPAVAERWGVERTTAWRTVRRAQQQLEEGN
jgi:hypothetical protein